jgi:hypothetical protein
MKNLTRVLAVLGSSTVVVALVVACGSNDDSEFGSSGGSSSGKFDPDGSFGTNKPDGGDPYANDPPPQWCGPAGQPVPPKPGGTADCPDDKNKPGCACLNPGETAPCWTGLRADRNLGVCKDGVTTCQQTGETTRAWGECVGQVLPTPGATKGAAACSCFSAGQWKIANLSPCSFTYCSIDPGAGNPCPAANITNVTAISTTTAGSCPAQPSSPPTAAPTEKWSTDTLQVDCAGRFKICYRIRAGNFAAPSSADCIIGEVCAPEADYTTPGVEQAWPDLAGWIGKDSACAKKWEYDTASNVSPGYGEMIVKGQSVLCEAIDDGAGGDLVFNRIQYCPKMCRDAANAGAAECVACQQSGQGSF